MKKWAMPYLMLSPFLLLIVVFFFFPILITAVMAFTDMDYSLQWNFIGFGNFEKMWLDPHLTQLVWNTVVFVTGTLLINVGFGLVLALLTSYFVKQEQVSMFFRALWMLPRISPPVVYVLLWLWFFDPSAYGMLNSIRDLLFGAEPLSWLVDHAMTAVIFASGMIGASFGMIIFSSAIQSIPQDLFKAAKVDGSSEWSIVMEIILPALKWPIMFVTVWQMLSLLTSYEYILLLTGGGPLFDSEVWSLYSFHKAFTNMEFGYGAAVAMVLVVIAFIMTMVLMKLFRFNEMVKNTRIE
jgi:inositol-phosphate transport system permease protein